MPSLSHLIRIPLFFGFPRVQPNPGRTDTHASHLAHGEPLTKATFPSLFRLNQKIHTWPITKTHRYENIFVLCRGSVAKKMKSFWRTPSASRFYVARENLSSNGWHQTKTCMLSRRNLLTEVRETVPGFCRDTKGVSRLKGDRKLLIGTGTRPVFCICPPPFCRHSNDLCERWVGPTCPLSFSSDEFIN